MVKRYPYPYMYFTFFFFFFFSFFFPQDAQIHEQPKRENFAMQFEHKNKSYHNKSSPLAFIFLNHHKDSV